MVAPWNSHKRTKHILDLFSLLLADCTFHRSGCEEYTWLIDTLHKIVALFEGYRPKSQKASKGGNKACAPRTKLLWVSTLCRWNRRHGQTLKAD